MTQILRLAVLCLAMMLGTPLAADTAGAFEAKRVKPPAPGTTKRITVQVPPRDNPAVPPLPGSAAPTVVAAPAPSAEPPLGAYSWFWDVISPAGTDSNPGRLDPALRALAAARPPVAAPRLQDLQDIAQAHGIDILTQTIGTQVSPALVLAIIFVESSGRAQAVSSAGATGLMQLMPDTATQFDVEDRTNPTQNIAGGVRYLDWLMQRFDRDPILVLAGYNAGAGTVRDHAGVPPFAETRDYVPKVLAAFQVARGLCLTAPELISDGCVFRVMQ